MRGMNCFHCGMELNLMIDGETKVKIGILAIDIVVCKNLR